MGKKIAHFFWIFSHCAYVRMRRQLIWIERQQTCCLNFIHKVGISPQHLLEGSDARREFIHHQNNIYYNNSSFNINSSVLFNRVPYYSNPWSTQQTDNYFSYYYQRLPQWQQFRYVLKIIVMNSGFLKSFG